MHRARKLTVSVPLFVLATAASGVAQSLCGLHGEVVIANGDPAPGIAGKQIYIGSAFGFGTPVLDQNGTVLVQARLAPSGSDDRAIFIGHHSGDMQLVVQSGSAHGIAGLPANILLQSSSTTSGSGLENDPVISPDGGLVYFGSRLYDPANPANTPSDADSALFWGIAGGLQLLAREGDQVPGLAAGVNYGALAINRQYNKINRNGLATVACSLTGAVTSADDAALLIGSPANMQVVMREGDDAGLGNGETFVPASGSTMSFTVIINDADQILLSPRLGGTAVADNDRCMAIWTPGIGVTVFAREGDQAPGMATGVVLTSTPGLGSSSFGNGGNSAFSWTVDDGGVTISSANDQVLWYGGLGGIAKIHQEGDPTGLPGGETYGVVNNTSITTDGNGTIAFFTSLRDATGTSLPSGEDSAMVYRAANGTTTFLVREGNVISAIPPSSNGPWTCRNVTGTTSLNANGQLLFNQGATDGVDIITFFLIYDPVHGLQVARDQNETYTTNLGSGPATGSTSTGGGFSGSGGSPCWFNNSGDFVFRQSIDNGPEAAIVKGHSGTLIATPSFVEIAAGGTHTFTIDAGPANANTLYAVIGSMSGNYPGTVVPNLGPLTIPLNFDSFTNATIALFNSPAYGNTLAFTDGMGRATATFHLPPGSYGLPGGLYHHAVIGLDLATLTETFVSEPSALKLF